jgi:hypothetical protein
MAGRKKRVARTAKAPGGKARVRKRKLVAKRAAPKKAKKTAKKLATKSRPRAKKRIKARQAKQFRPPVIEDTIVDVIDEPVPGVVRVTEIEEVSAALPDSQEENED